MDRRAIERLRMVRERRREMNRAREVTRGDGNGGTTDNREGRRPQKRRKGKKRRSISRQKRR